MGAKFNGNENYEKFISNVIRIGDADYEIPPKGYMQYLTEKFSIIDSRFTYLQEGHKRLIKLLKLSRQKCDETGLAADIGNCRLDEIETDTARKFADLEKRLADIESIALEREADTRDRFDKIEKAIAELSMTPYSDQQPKVGCFVRMEDFEGREIACRYMKLAKPPISGDNIVYAGLMYEVDDAAITWTREGVCTCELSVWERGNAIVF